MIIKEEISNLQNAEGRREGGLLSYLLCQYAIKNLSVFVSLKISLSGKQPTQKVVQRLVTR